MTWHFELDLHKKLWTSRQNMQNSSMALHTHLSYSSLVDKQCLAQLDSAERLAILPQTHLHHAAWGDNQHEHVQFGGLSCKVQGWAVTWSS